ncbi:hypothetical protein ACQR2L_09755 [Clostridium butyricum]|uniref:hypothetical protein n=1 Tax=Clostridium butyricum TaxID=1492 RepID=UPI003D0E8013
MSIEEKIMQWECPYCGHKNTDTLLDLDYGTVLCRVCEKPSDVYFDVKPIDVIVKGVANE